jgi:hypothetical protein
MSDYKPSVRTLIMVLASFFAVVLPAIWFTGMGYVWFIEHGLKFDTTAKPEGLVDRLLVLVAVLPMIPLMVLAIFISGIPWMFFMSRVLSWAEIQHFTKQKGPRLPFVSAWLDRMWIHMTQSRKPASPPGESPQ